MGFVSIDKSTERGKVEAFACLLHTHQAKNGFFYIRLTQFEDLPNNGLTVPLILLGSADKMAYANSVNLTFLNVS